MRAENGTQTRDPQLGRLVLYRLSYFRKLPVANLRELWLRRVAKVNFHSPRSNLPRELTFARDLRRCGCGWIRTTEAEKQQIYSLPHLATLEHTLVATRLRQRNAMLAFGSPRLLLSKSQISAMLRFLILGFH